MTLNSTLNVNKKRFGYNSVGNPYHYDFLNFLELGDEFDESHVYGALDDLGAVTAEAVVVNGDAAWSNDCHADRADRL